MNQQQIRQGILEIVCEVFALAPDTASDGISPDKVAGWDSEKHVILIIALEDRFGCEFEAEDVPELVSLERMEAIIARHVASGE